MSQVFERRRRALFARHGFHGEGRLVLDRHGRPTYALSSGQGPSPTILVHGGLSEASEWAPIASRLPEPVVIPDRPGCGLSHAIDYRGVDFRRAAVEWLLDLVNGVGAAEIDLVGNSMGGFFAMAFAKAHPERVRRLVLVGAPAGLDRSVPLFLRLWGNRVTGAFLVRLGLTAPPTPEALRDRVFARLLVAHPERVPADLLGMLHAACALPGAALAARTMLRNVLTLRGWRPDLLMREPMARLAVPTRFVWGEKDAFASPSSGRELAARMPNADLVEIPDAGHLPWLDDPVGVVRAIGIVPSRT